MTEDIIELILDDHNWFRRQFSALDETSDPEKLRRIWEPLAALLDLHAVAEEETFYPLLLRDLHDTEQAEEETRDAIGDHNEIRDGVHEAARHPVGSPEWWAAVRSARVANSHHMAEEEDEGLADFRRTESPQKRAEVGRRFLEFKERHAGAGDIDTDDKDPSGYINAIEAELAGADRGSLGIGSLKGR
jgi:hypothetical protein